MTRNQELNSIQKDFIKRNIEAEVNQIFDAESIEFGQMRIWAGRIELEKERKDFPQDELT